MLTIYTWLAFMAIKRLEKTKLSKNYRKNADSLRKWFKNNRDSGVQGAWYPDAIIKDMASSHILKYEHDETTKGNYSTLASNIRCKIFPTSAGLTYWLFQVSPRFTKTILYSGITSIHCPPVPRAEYVPVGSSQFGK